VSARLGNNVQGPQGNVKTSLEQVSG